jgi:hypothetical protein
VPKAAFENAGGVIEHVFEIEIAWFEVVGRHFPPPSEISDCQYFLTGLSFPSPQPAHKMEGVFV